MNFMFPCLTWLGLVFFIPAANSLLNRSVKFDFIDNSGRSLKIQDRVYSTSNESLLVKIITTQTLNESVCDASEVFKLCVGTETHGNHSCNHAKLTMTPDVIFQPSDTFRLKFGPTVYHGDVIVVTAWCVDKETDQNTAMLQTEHVMMDLEAPIAGTILSVPMVFGNRGEGDVSTFPVEWEPFLTPSGIVQYNISLIMPLPIPSTVLEHHVSIRCCATVLAINHTLKNVQDGALLVVRIVGKSYTGKLATSVHRILIDFSPPYLDLPNDLPAVIGSFSEVNFEGERCWDPHSTVGSMEVKVEGEDDEEYKLLKDFNKEVKMKGLKNGFSYRFQFRCKNAAGSTTERLSEEVYIAVGSPDVISSVEVYPSQNGFIPKSEFITIDYSSTFRTNVYLQAIEVKGLKSNRKFIAQTEPVWMDPPVKASTGPLTVTMFTRTLNASIVCTTDSSDPMTSPSVTFNVKSFTLSAEGQHVIRCVAFHPLFMVSPKSYYNITIFPKVDVTLVDPEMGYVKVGGGADNYRSLTLQYSRSHPNDVVHIADAYQTDVCNYSLPYNRKKHTVQKTDSQSMRISRVQFPQPKSINGTASNSVWRLCLQRYGSKEYENGPVVTVHRPIRWNPSGDAEQRYEGTQVETVLSTLQLQPHGKFQVTVEMKTIAGLSAGGASDYFKFDWNPPNWVGDKNVRLSKGVVSWSPCSDTEGAVEYTVTISDSDSEDTFDLDVGAETSLATGELGLRPRTKYSLSIQCKDRAGNVANKRLEKILSL
eukprot:PhF_6_TR11552/c0_g3_i1/m.18565